MTKKIWIIVPILVLITAKSFALVKKAKTEATAIDGLWALESIRCAQEDQDPKLQQKIANRHLKMRLELRNGEFEETSLEYLGTGLQWVGFAAEGRYEQRDGKLSLVRKTYKMFRSHEYTAEETAPLVKAPEVQELSVEASGKSFTLISPEICNGERGRLVFAKLESDSSQTLD